GNLLTLWRFYSTQYLSFSENIAPRGLLERLFTFNPVVRPIVDAPAVAYGLWLLIAAATFVLTLAVIAPRPIRRDTRSFLEFGVIVSGLMLISPLTEPPYLVMLIIPAVAAFAWITRRADRYARLASILLIAWWIAESIPRQFTENFLRAHT